MKKPEVKNLVTGSLLNNCIYYEDFNRIGRKSGMLSKKAWRLSL
jgi:hypothetical protein